MEEQPPLIALGNFLLQQPLREVAVNALYEDGGGDTLFAGAESGGECDIYSLIGTAKLNGAHTEALLCYVRTLISDRPVNRIDKSLP